MLVNPFDPQQRAKMEEAIADAKPLVKRTLELIDRLPAFAEAMRKAKVNGIELLAAWHTWCTDSQHAVIDYANEHAGDDERLGQLLSNRDTQLANEDPEDWGTVVTNRTDMLSELESAARRHFFAAHVKKHGAIRALPRFEPLGRPQPPNLWGFSSTDVFNASTSDRQALACFWLSQIVRRVQPGALRVDEPTVEIGRHPRDWTHLDHSAATVLGHYDRVSFGYLGLSGLTYRSSSDPLAPKTLIDLLDRCLDEIERDLAKPEHWQPVNPENRASFVPLACDAPILRELVKAATPLRQTQIAETLKLKGGKAQQLGNRVRLYEDVGLAERPDGPKGGTRLTDAGRPWAERWLSGLDQPQPTPGQATRPSKTPHPHASRKAAPGRTSGTATKPPQK